MPLYRTFSSASWCCAGSRLIPGKAGGRQLSCSQLWRCFVVLAWVNRFTRHQYKHRCWCYQWLLLVCLFICIKPVTRNLPKAWEHPDQRAVREPAAVVFSNTTSHAMTRICPIPRTLTRRRVARAWQDAWSPLRTHRHSEMSVLKPAKASTDWGTVALGCLFGQLHLLHAACTVHQNRGVRGAGPAKHEIRLDEHPYRRCFIIKPKPFCNRARFTHRQ